MTAVVDVLAQHVDRPDDRHWLRLLDPWRLRCHTCSRTIDLRPLGKVPVEFTSTSQIPLPLRHPDACPLHVGQHANHCGPCRSECWG